MVGLLFGLLKRRIDKRLDASEQKQIKRSQLLVDRDKALSELRHAQGRVLFWLKKSVKDHYVNGELDKAFAHYEEVEEKLKALDRDIVAQYEGK